MGADVLAMLGARASATLIFTKLNRINSVPTQQGLTADPCMIMKGAQIIMGPQMNNWGVGGGGVGWGGGVGGGGGGGGGGAVDCMWAPYKYMGAPIW